MESVDSPGVQPRSNLLLRLLLEELSTSSIVDVEDKNSRSIFIPRMLVRVGLSFVGFTVPSVCTAVPRQDAGMCFSDGVPGTEPTLLSDGVEGVVIILCRSSFLSATTAFCTNWSTNSHRKSLLMANKHSSESQDFKPSFATKIYLKCVTNSSSRKPA